MREGERAKELQLELARPRNPYLEEQFGSSRTQGKKASYAGKVQAMPEGRDRMAAGGGSRAYGGSARAVSYNGRPGISYGRSGSRYAEAERGRSAVHKRAYAVEPDRPRPVADRARQERQIREKERQRRMLERQKQQKRRRQQKVITVLLLMVVIALMFYGLVRLFVKDPKQGNVQDLPDKKDVAAPVMNQTAQHPDWTTDYLTPNEYSRPGDAMGEVSSIFVHYTANPGTSAANNRSYFEQLKDTHERSASAHFIIGYEGEIIQCIPLNEIAYGVQTRNYDSISIECCYLDKENASFTKETYNSLVELLVYLLQTYHLTSEDILRHYDCGGKLCPLYYVENEDAWEALKQEVAQKLAEAGN